MPSIENDRTAITIIAGSADSPLDAAFVSLCDLSLPGFSTSASHDISGACAIPTGTGVLKDTTDQAALAISVGAVDLGVLDRCDMAPFLLCEEGEDGRDQISFKQRDEDTKPATASQSRGSSAHGPVLGKADGSRSDVCRARNRMAASKCRKKQKRQREDLQKDAEQLCARNKRLKRQEHLLRNAVTFLRDCALQHDSTRCDCESLHTFNIQRAEDFYQMFSGANPT